MQLITLFFVFVIFVVSVHTNMMWSGLGFNLPNTRFCQPCILNRSLQIRSGRSVQSDIVDATDHECRDYVHTMGSTTVDSFTLQRSLVAMLEDLEDPTAFIFYARLAAQIIFERIYNKPYTLLAIVETNLNAEADFCIYIHTSGEGFKNQIDTAENIDKKIEERGRNYEKDYLTAISDYWVINTCNQTFHGIHVTNARKRFGDMQINGVRCDSDLYTGQRPIAFDIRNLSYLPECGKKPSYREIPSDLPSPCPSSVCDQTPQRRRILGTITNVNDISRVPANTPLIRATSSTVVHSQAKPNPNIFINELYPCKPGSTATNQFIELRSYPMRNSHLIRNAKVVVLSMVSLRIVTVANLLNLHFNQNGFLAIYAQDQFVHLSKDIDIDNNLLPCSIAEPFAVLLLEKHDGIQTDAWAAIKLKGQRSRRTEVSTSIDRPAYIGKNKDPINLVNVLKETVIDAYFYGQLQNNPTLDTILNILPMYKMGCNFVLSVGKPSDETEMAMSINSCPEGDPENYMYRKFKLGNPTPWEDNNCPYSNTWLYEIMEHDIEMNTVGVTVDPNYPYECPMVEDVGGVIADITQEIEFISKSFQQSYQSPYYPVPQMSDYAITRSLYNSEANWDMISPFEHVPENEKGLGSEGFVVVRCKICHLRLKLCPHSVRGNVKKDGLSQKEGVVLPTKESSAHYILKRHLHRKQHYYSVLNEIRHYKITESADRRIRFNREANDNDKHLAAAFLTSFTIFKTNTAVYNSKSWFRTLTLLNADVSQHWTSANSVWNLMKFVSNEGLVNIKRNMMEKQLPFSFLLDASSDRTNTHYVLFFVQTTEGEYSIVYFVGLIKLGKSSTAEAYMDSIKTFLADSMPGFEEYFKRNCVALITDGASTMIKLQSDFNTWLDRKDARGQSSPIISLFCLSHRLQLASRNSLIPLRSDSDLGLGECLKYFAVAEMMTQNMYTFIKLSSRRIAEFREIVETTKQPRCELAELHTERWISSEHRTVKYFLCSWISSTKTMEVIVSDPNSYPAAVRENAEKYIEVLHDKDFLITMVFLQDYTSVFKVWSEHSQYFAGLLIDHERYYYKLDHELTRMEALQGPVLTSFLQSCKCSASSNPNDFGCTVLEYEVSETVYWKDQKFITKDQSSPAISILGPELIRKTRAKINHYIPKRIIDAFGVLQPFRLPPGLKPLSRQNPVVSNSDATPVYGKKEIIQLASYFGMPHDETLRDWSLLVQSMVSSETWQQLRTDLDTNSFWARAVSEKGFIWTDLTLKLIRSAKAVSGGTAVVESGFSRFNIIKSKLRNRLSDEHVTTALSVLINGPADVDTFDYFHYANMYKKLSSVKKPDGDNDNCGEPSVETDNEDDLDLDLDNDEYSGEGNGGNPLADIYDNFFADIIKQRKPTRIRSVFM